MEEEKKKPGRPKKVDASENTETASFQPSPDAPQGVSKDGFDSSKPYGTVHGGDSGARFYQDGKFYSGDGREVDLS